MFNNPIYSHPTVINLAKEMRSSSKNSLSNEAIFEIKYVEEVPAKVALNEALELTKKYSDDESRKFVNGVLSNIMATESSEK